MKKVIIADDSSLARIFTARCLSAAGYGNYEVTECKDGQEVYALLSESSYDLVISDLNMPEMDGIELMERISADPAMVKIPVIIITSAGSGSQREQLYNLGVKGIISKPITPSDMVQAVGTILDFEESSYV